MAQTIKSTEEVKSKRKTVLFTPVEEKSMADDDYDEEEQLP